MKAYKATYNFKCRNQNYKVGKTYTSDKLEMCKHGMHFCSNKEDVLTYYNHNKDFVLLEVKILGDVITKNNKSVTNKLKVLRVIPFEEYNFKNYVIDDRNNMISETYSDGYKRTYEYDDRNNMIFKTYSNGYNYTYEYTYEYDGNNMISKTCSDGSKKTYKYTYEYDGNNMISKTCSDGSKRTYEYATIEETD